MTKPVPRSRFLTKWNFGLLHTILGFRQNWAMRIFFSVLLSCAICETLLAQLPGQLDRIVSAHGIPYQGISILVKELHKEEPVLSHNAEVPRNPASTIKLLTTWVALEVLGPTYRWPTEIYFLGEWDGRRLDGDLGIKGYGDPYLVTEEFWNLLRELRRNGLEEITGDLVIDDSFFARVQTNPRDFDGQPYRSYNVTPNALLLNYQAVRFQFRVHSNGREVLIASDPILDNLIIENSLELVNGACGGYQAGISFDIRDPDFGKTAVFSGSFSEACAPYSLYRSVLRHDTYAHGLFSTLWRDLGGIYAGEVTSQKIEDRFTPELVWQSRSLAEVIRSINKYSNNVMTRQLLLTLGAKENYVPATHEGGVEVIRNFLIERGLDPLSLVIENGAGLSRDSRISASLLSDILELAQTSPFGSEFMASMSIGGLDGTTRGRFGPAQEGRAHVKTGRLDNVAAISGYVHAANGKTYTVSAMVNATDAHRGPGVELLDELIAWVYSLR